MVRDFQSVIGREAREQILEKEGRLAGFIGRVCRRRFKFDRAFSSVFK